MQRKADLADQTKPGLPQVDEKSILQCLTTAQAEKGSWSCAPSKYRVRAWPIVLAGLLRDLAGMTHQRVALALDLPQRSAQVRARQHRHLMQQDRNYARRSAELASACFEVLRNP